MTGLYSSISPFHSYNFNFIINYIYNDSAIRKLQIRSNELIIGEGVLEHFLLTLAVVSLQVTEIVKLFFDFHEDMDGLLVIQTWTDHS